MADTRVVVQPCGCIALPKATAVRYGVLPGALVSVDPDPVHQRIAFTLVEHAPVHPMRAVVACLVRP